MKTAPTASGIPISVAPMWPGAYISVAELARAAGFDSVRAMLADIDDGDAPSLPYTLQMGGQRMTASDHAKDWIADLVKLRARKNERDDERAARQAKQREEAAAARQAAFDAEVAANRERWDMFRSAERANALELEGKDSGRGGAITPFSGGSV